MRAILLDFFLSEDFLNPKCDHPPLSPELADDNRPVPMQSWQE